MHSMDPRVLIISNECLSDTGSNGRTLRNFFLGWPQEKLAQFYIRNGFPDFNVCTNYFCRTDMQALKAMLGKKIGNGMVQKESVAEFDEPSVFSATNKLGRNAFSMLAREVVWACGLWKRNGFVKWIQAYQPEVIVLQAGDCGFMYSLAVKISEQYDIPLIIYNSESYYFKEDDYFQSRGMAHFIYPLFRLNLRRRIRKAICRASMSVYCCEKLNQVYKGNFSSPSMVIFTATETRPLTDSKKREGFTTSYLGNLGVGRHEALIELANALHSVSGDLYLDIYGRVPNEHIKEALDSCPGIRYFGFVSYQEVQRIMSESDLLVHCESFSPFYRKDLQFAFSTKIADSLASGTCFLLYAPGEMACTEYLKENQAAYVVDDSAELKNTLQEIVSDKAAREKYIENALKLVERNHSAVSNSERFQTMIREIVGKKK